VGAADGRLPPGEPRWNPGLSLCVVLAAEGYPGKVRGGDAIDGLRADGQAEQGGATVFHAGTRRQGERFVTAGGRVLGISAVDRDLDSARAKVYEAVAGVRWAGVHYRKDIGLRGKQ
jgi:phosphoribosylamine--glycine ligase